MAAWTGCKKTESSVVPVAQTGGALDPCDPVDIDRSLVIHDQATLGAADFTFARTIQAIRLSSGGSATTDAALVQSLLADLLAPSFNNPVSGLPMPVNPREPEAALDPNALLNGPTGQMRPVALFNRFDLAPADGSHCGEYRIVYGRFPNSTFQRFLLIFEAVLPNPQPAQGLLGCLPVVAFWHNLSDPAVTPAQRASMLADFYYVGVSGLVPVVRHANYGVPLGQVRSNMFLEQPWELREWRTAFNVSGQPIFRVDTDKQNPLAQLYNENSSNPNPALFASEQAAFLGDFTGVQMPILGNTNVAFPVSPRCDAVNAIGSAFPNRFNEFQGTSQGNADNPRTVASVPFRNAITANMGGMPFDANQMLNRAGTQACGGCHEFSNSQDIGLGQTWPPSAGFVHVNEQGAVPPTVSPLSQALTECFLPARRAILESFMCSSSPTDAGVLDAAAPDAPAEDASVPDAGGAPDAGGPPDSGLQSCDAYHPCGPYAFCDFGPYNTCGASGPGVCQPRPPSCGYGSQVCGCDGQTYPSECAAHQAGTDVAHLGACSCTAPAGCCFADADCTGKGEECIGASCSSGQAGVCKGQPPKGYCWEDEDCPRGETCQGERICPCGTICRQMDAPGTCGPAPTPLPLPPVRTVTEAREDLLQAQSSAEAASALQSLDSAVETERAAEAAKPGAFWPHRRTH